MHATTPTLPGNLQLRFALLKKSPARLDCVCDALRGISGIEHVEARAASGTILIRYACEAGNSHRFWDTVEAVLEYNHLYHDQHALDEAVSPPNRVRRLMRRSAQAFAAVLR